VMHGGHGDGGRIEFEIGGEQLFSGSEDGDAVLGRGFSGARRVLLNGRCQSDAEARVLKLAVHAKMISSKRPGPGDCNPQSGLAGYLATPDSGPLPSTERRQRP